MGVVYGCGFDFGANSTLKMSSSSTSAPAVAEPSTQPAGPSARPPERRGGALNASHIEKRRQRKKFAVKRLEKKLENYHRQIKRFSEEEVSMDDMMSGSSAYLKEDYVKRKFLATWEELCDVLKIPSTIEVSHEEENGSYSGTGYPEINRRLQRLLKNDQFPDHMDICEMIERCNTKHKLGISSSEKVELSRKVFKEVGKIIKSRRIKDYRAHFGSHLTDAVVMEDDPATRDQVLLEQLKKSMDQGQKLMQDLVDGFVVKQEVEVEKRGDILQGDSCNSDEEGEGEGEGEETVIDLDKDGEADSDEGEVDSDDERDKEEAQVADKASDSVCEVNSEDDEVGNGSPPIKRLKLVYESGVSSPCNSSSPSPSGQDKSSPSRASGDSIDVVSVGSELPRTSDHHRDSYVTIISDSEDNEVTTSILDHDDSDVVIISDSD